MTSQQSLVSHAIQIRKIKRSKLYTMFAEHLGERFNSAVLHTVFGPSVRTRISEIRRDPLSAITIKNRTWVENGKECSEYWAEVRP